MAMKKRTLLLLSAMMVSAIATACSQHRADKTDQAAMENPMTNMQSERTMEKPAAEMQKEKMMEKPAPGASSEKMMHDM
jgi:hypothetical protein